MDDELITLHTRQLVNTKKPPRVECEGTLPNGEPDIRWYDEHDNPVPEGAMRGGFFVSVTVPIRLRRDDILAVLPDYDPMDGWIGAPPDRTELVLKYTSNRIEVLEEANVVLEMLGWGRMEIGVARPWPRY